MGEVEEGMEKGVIVCDGGMICGEDIDGGKEERREKGVEEVERVEEMEKVV